MNKDVLFWIFAIIQGYVIYYAFSTLILTNRVLTNYVYSSDISNAIPESLSSSLLFGGLLVISTIGIEYLIYSKLKNLN